DGIRDFHVTGVQTCALPIFATFLGNPRMQLLEAVVQAMPDSHIDLVIGEQSLLLPWSHSRARIISRYHGERIAVGIRPEALTPVAPDTPGDVLNGRIQYLEHHGHETLAFLDVGATAILLDDMVAAPQTRPRGSRLRRLSNLMSRFTNRGRSASSDAAEEPRHASEPQSVLHDPQHHHRPAE